MAEKPSGPGLISGFSVLIACKSLVMSMGLSISSATEANKSGRPLSVKYSINWILVHSTDAGL